MLVNPDAEVLADTGVVGAEGMVEVARARGDIEDSVAEGEVEVPKLPSEDSGRGLDTEDDAPRPSMLRSRGGAGSIPDTGADDGGIGSTEDCRCK